VENSVKELEMSQCKTTADVLRRAADMMDMCRNTDVNAIQCIKYGGGSAYGYNGNPELYEFAHRILEGKPVFTGDVVYDSYGRHYTVKEDGWPMKYKDSTEEMSWTKPTPRKMITMPDGSEIPTPDGVYTDYCVTAGDCFYFYKNKEDLLFVKEALQKLMESGK
jgi:hypothetical protein